MELVRCLACDVRAMDDVCGHGMDCDEAWTGVDNVSGNNVYR